MWIVSMILTLEQTSTDAECIIIMGLKKFLWLQAEVMSTV